MGIYVFSREILLDLIATQPGVDFGREIIPAALSRHRVHAYFYRGYWADVGTVKLVLRSEHPAHAARRAVQLLPPAPPDLHAPALPAGVEFYDCRIEESMVAEGGFLEHCTVRESVVGIRTHVARGSHVTRSVLIGADFYEDEAEAPARGDRPRLGVGRDVVLDRVIVDKNARIGDGVRLVNEAGVQEADGHGYVIREGIIVVPKDATVPAGTRV